MESESELSEESESEDESEDESESDDDSCSSIARRCSMINLGAFYKDGNQCLEHIGI